MDEGVYDGGGYDGASSSRGDGWVVEDEADPSGWRSGSERTMLA